jgi:hypothetical protein
LRGLAGPGDVRCQQQVGHIAGQQRVRLRRRLDLENVDGRARDETLAQALRERLRIHEGAAAGIDQHGRGLHRRQALRID